MHKPTTNDFEYLPWHWVSGGATVLGGCTQWHNRHQAKLPASWYGDPTTSPIPGLRQTVERIANTGFDYVRASSFLCFQKSTLREQGSTIYGVYGWLHFTKDDLMFRQGVASAADASMSGAFDSIRFEYDRIALRSSVLIEGGKGQLARAQRQATDMLRRAGKACLFLDRCEVECRTSGGCGDWDDHTLTKRFVVADLLRSIEWSQKSAVLESTT